MEKIIKRELLIFSVILLVLIVLMHPDILNDPVGRLSMMQQQQNYVHPLLYTVFVYLVIFALRGLIGWVLRLFKGTKTDEAE